MSVELDDTPLELGLTKSGNNTYLAICIHLRTFLRNQDQHIAKQPIWRKKLQIRMETLIITTLRTYVIRKSL